MSSSSSLSENNKKVDGITTPVTRAVDLLKVHLCISTTTTKTNNKKHEPKPDTMLEKQKKK
jgi:hypothetical protein